MTSSATWRTGGECCEETPSSSMENCFGSLPPDTSLPIPDTYQTHSTSTMTTLVDIPSCTAVHLPTPTSSPLPLAFGDLTLTIIPANPPAHPSQTVTLTIGASSFPLLPNSPVQKIGSIKEHASYVFSPVPADGGAGIGQVKITMKDRHVALSSSRLEKS